MAAKRAHAARGTVQQWPKADWQLSDRSEGKQMFEICPTWGIDRYRDEL
jgi:hypothetical protein